MAAEVLSLNALEIGYIGKKTKVIASNITASLERGSLTALLGLNGSGKSTLIKTLCGFIPAIKGEIKICGRDVKTYSATEFALTVGVVLTSPTAAGGLTAKEMVSLGRHPHTGFWGRLSQKDYDIVERAMNAVGILEKSDHYVSSLSDGERQKVTIAKALAQESPLIVLDEPTAFLDIKSRRELMHLLAHLAHSEGKTILLSTHDLDLAIKECDNFWIMDKHKPFVSGNADFLASHNLLEDYFGLKE